eukprot:g19481.t1
MWSALHEDRSLARGGGHGKRLGNQEGFMLGLALIEEVSEDAAAEPPKTCTLPLQEVYCHVDLLAARGLPACDEDGLADPCYEVRVEDMVLQLQEPAALLDLMSLDLQDGELLDVNACHKAACEVALEMDTPVAETTDGLGRRARIGQVKTEMLMQYNISLDLLGIRGLKDEDEKERWGSSRKDVLRV